MPFVPLVEDVVENTFFNCWYYNEDALWLMWDLGTLTKLKLEDADFGESSS